MGHIRLGRLPKTKPWAGVFETLKGPGLDAAKLARATALSAQRQFSSLEGDRGVNYCFWVLVRIATAAREPDFLGELTGLGVRPHKATTGLGFVQEFSQAVEKALEKRTEPNVFVRMAQLSLREVLSRNVAEPSRTLFGTDLGDIHAACRAMSTRLQFGRVAREFFSGFVGRCIRYVADKEISNHIGPGGAAGSPAHILALYQSLARYCRESSKIIEQFAGGWFSKHNWETNRDIPEEAAAGFTAYALQKIRMELAGAEK